MVRSRVPRYLCRRLVMLVDKHTNHFQCSPDASSIARLAFISVIVLMEILLQ